MLYVLCFDRLVSVPEIKPAGDTDSNQQADTKKQSIRR